MSHISEHELVALGTHVFCKCSNAVPRAVGVCPYCHLVLTPEVLAELITEETA